MICPSPYLRFTEEYAFTFRDAVDRAWNTLPRESRAALSR